MPTTPAIDVPVKATPSPSTVTRIEQAIVDVVAQLPKLPLSQQQAAIISGLTAALGLGLDAGVLSGLAIQAIVGAASILLPLGVLIWNASHAHAQAKVATAALHAHVRLAQPVAPSVGGALTASPSARTPADGS